jgi:hypothetical protein
VESPVRNDRAFLYPLKLNVQLLSDLLAAVLD